MLACRAGLFESQLTLNQDRSKNQVDRSMYFSCIKTFLTAYVLCRLRLFKFKTGQKI